MSAHRSRRVFVEANEFCAVVVQTESRGQRTTIESIREIGSVERGTAEVATPQEPGAGLAQPVHCTVRPAKCAFHLATEDEARQLVTVDSIRRHLASGPFCGLETWQLALTSSGEAPFGSAGRAGRWLATGVPVSSIDATRRRIQGIGAAPAEVGSAVFASLAAVRRLLKSTGQSGSVVVLELGAGCSTAFLVNCDGIQSVVPVPVGFEHLVDAVAQEASLRMRGAAAKLFFNPEFDFSEIAMKIARRLAPEVKAALGALSADRDRPPSGFFCAGLPGAQAWFGHSLSETIGLDPWKPAIRVWMEKAGVEFSPTAREQLLLPEWLGILGTVEAMHRGAVSEKSSWFVEGAVTTNAAKTQPAGARAPAAATTPARVETSARSMHQRKVPAFPRPLESTPVGSILPEASAKTADVDGPRFDPAAGTPPPEVQAAFSSATSGERERSATRRFRLAPVLSLAAIVVVAGALGVVYFRQVARQKAEAAAEVAAAAQRAAADAEALRIAEQKAREEAEARRQAEALAAEQVARAEEARLRAEEQAREREAEARRLLAARGSLRVVTEPAGAIVAVGNYAPRQTPAVIDDLRLGHYPVSVTLEGYDPVNLEVEVVDEGTIDPGLIRLTRQLGTIALETHPAGVVYDVRPAGARLFVASAETRQGTTPASIDDLPPGDYVVTLLREGWPRQAQTVTVRNHETTSVTHRFAGATLKIASEPAGARVTINGAVVGTTPLNLSDVAPGELAISLSMEGFHAAEVVRTVRDSEQAELDVVLESLERLARQAELDHAPVAILQVQPNLPPAIRTDVTRVVVSCVVGRDGVPQEIVVDGAPDEETGRACIAAVAQWRFTPGLIKGQPVRTRVSIPFMIR